MMRRANRQRIRTLEAETHSSNHVRVLEIALHATVTRSEPVLVDVLTGPPLAPGREARRPERAMRSSACCRFTCRCCGMNQTEAVRTTAHQYRVRTEASGYTSAAEPMVLTW